MYKSRIDLTGAKFGRWTVLRKSDRPYHWVCRCTCGEVREVIYIGLLNGTSRSCGNHPRGEEYHPEGEFDINGPLTFTDPRYPDRLQKVPMLRRETKKAHEKYNFMGTDIRAIQKAKMGNNKSGHTGVFYKKKSKTWQAHLRFKYKRINLGTYKTKEEAIAARKEGEEIYYEPVIKAWEAKQRGETVSDPLDVWVEDYGDKNKPKTKIDLTDRRYGAWTVIKRANRKHYWTCRCDCGEVHDIFFLRLITGNSRSCGCDKNSDKDDKGYHTKA